MENLKIVTNWAFSKRENGIWAAFQLDDKWLILFNKEDGFYIPEGEEGGNWQCWTEEDNGFGLQEEFEKQNDADDIARIYNLNALLNEASQCNGDDGNCFNDYEFTIYPDSSVAGFL